MPRKFLLLALLLGLGWLAAGPYLALYRMWDAAGRGDAAELAARIDFPAVRAGLAERAAAGWLGAAERPEDRGPLSGLLTGALAGAAERALEFYVTPEGAIELAAKARAGGGAVARISMGYESPRRFSVLAVERGGTRYRLTLLRRGLDWRLTEAVVER